jgi:dihydrofolate reductase
MASIGHLFLVYFAIDFERRQQKNLINDYMKKVILDLAVTLDGFIEGPNSEIDWCIMDDDMDFDGFLSGIDTIFYGRVSYDAWGNFQPDRDASPTEQEIWKEVHTKHKFVFSSQSRQDERATFISADIADKVTEIKQQGGKDIWLYGGASLIKTFIQADLVDVYRISVHPIALGSGKPLFEDLKERLPLRLIKTNIFKSGVVQLIYEPGK